MHSTPEVTEHDLDTYGVTAEAIAGMLRNEANLLLLAGDPLFEKFDDLVGRMRTTLTEYSLVTDRLIRQVAEAKNLLGGEGSE